ncbi:hypothetical protein PAPHI01_2175 [Pancytospora philotis]|nr:hypothetical protein PAPHI01_2175 [Pancytospora philotis]
MPGKPLADALDLETLRRRRILVDEQLPQNCDFLLAELVLRFGYSLRLYNDSTAHFSEILGRLGCSGALSSVYQDEAGHGDIADDVWTARHVLGKAQSNAYVDVYRAGTARVADYYGYDFVVRIEPLASGCSESIDGCLKVISRDNVLRSLKYKVFRDGAVCYE